jgi:hypothetical protein
MGDARPSPRHIWPHCPRCDAHLAPEHATDDSCNRWLCSELCCEWVHVDSWAFPRAYKKHVEPEPHEEDGLVIVDGIDDDSDE